MLIRPIFALILAAPWSINSVPLADKLPINWSTVDAAVYAVVDKLPINWSTVDAADYPVELPPLSEPAIAYDIAVRLNPPITAPAPEPIRFTSDSANGRCVGAEGLLSEYARVGWSIERMSRIMYRESRCLPLVRNASGATGLLQIMPSNCRYIARQLGESCTVAKLQVPEFNIRAATTLFEYDGYGPWAQTA